MEQLLLLLLRCGNNRQLGILTGRELQLWEICKENIVSFLIAQ